VGTQDKKKPHQESFALVGELVLISNALDHLLNEVLIEVLNLVRSTMLLPVIATLDPVRKIEILKARAKHIDNLDWRKGVSSFVDKVERVFRYRNLACHTQPILTGNKWTLQPFAAAKILKEIDVGEKRFKPTPFEELKGAISTAEAALGSGVNLIENFKRLNAELAKRSTAANSASS
jgi:hypothetical protein